MRAEVFCLRHKPLEGVDEKAGHPFYLTAMTFPQGAVKRISVHPVPCRPIAVFRVEDVRFTVFENRHDSLIDFRYFQVWDSGNTAYFGSEPPAAQMVFEEAVNAIHVPAKLPSGDDDMPADSFYDIPFIAESFEVYTGTDLFEMAVVADYDFVFCQRFQVGDDRDIGAGYFFEEFLQFAGSVSGRK